MWTRRTLRSNCSAAASKTSASLPWMSASTRSTRRGDDPAAPAGAQLDHRETVAGLADRGQDADPLQVRLVNFRVVGPLDAAGVRGVLADEPARARPAAEKVDPDALVHLAVKAAE